MALLKYLERKRSALPDERACSSTSLTGKDLKLANQAVARAVPTQRLGDVSEAEADEVQRLQPRTASRDRQIRGREWAHKNCHTFLPCIECDLPHYRVRSLGKVVYTYGLTNTLIRSH